MDECWQHHTQADTDANFAKPILQQDPFFGVTAVLQRLVRRSNDIRYPSRFLALDEEIISLLGRCNVAQYCKDKKNSRGPKVFSLNGCNLVEPTLRSLLETDNILKGYYHGIELYRAKARDQPSPSAVFGKGFDVVCRAVFEMKLRFKGYYLVCDSWYTSIPLLNQLTYWVVNFLGTIRQNRKGLRGTGTDEQPFADIKKLLEKDYDDKLGGKEGSIIPSSSKTVKRQGYKKGAFTNRKIRGQPIVVTIQKDSKVMTESANCVPLEATLEVERYDRETARKEKISV